MRALAILGAGALWLAAFSAQALTQCGPGQPPAGAFVPESGAHGSIVVASASQYLSRGGAFGIVGATGGNAARIVTAESVLAEFGRLPDKLNITIGADERIVAIEPGSPGVWTGDTPGLGAPILIPRQTLDPDGYPTIEGAGTQPISISHDHFNSQVMFGDTNATDGHLAANLSHLDFQRPNPHAGVQPEAPILQTRASALYNALAVLSFRIGLEVRTCNAFHLVGGYFITNRHCDVLGASERTLWLGELNWTEGALRPSGAELACVLKNIWPLSRTDGTPLDLSLLWLPVDQLGSFATNAVIDISAPDDVWCHNGVCADDPGAQVRQFEVWSAHYSGAPPGQGSDQTKAGMKSYSTRPCSAAPLSGVTDAQACSFLDYRTGYGHTCSSDDGASGSPLFDERSLAQFLTGAATHVRLAGVHRGGALNGGNCAIPATMLRETLPENMWRGP